MEVSGLLLHNFNWRVFVVVIMKKIMTAYSFSGRVWAHWDKWLTIWWFVILANVITKFWFISDHILLIRAPSWCRVTRWYFSNRLLNILTRFKFHIEGHRLSIQMSEFWILQGIIVILIKYVFCKFSNILIETFNWSWTYINALCITPFSTCIGKNVTERRVLFVFL